MPDPTPRSRYLFLLAKPSIPVRREAAKRLRELGLRVPVQHGGAALEVMATPEEAERAYALGLFSAYLRGRMKDAHVERLPPGQREVATQWNVRFSPAFRKRKAEGAGKGASWGDGPGLPPEPPVRITPEAFREAMGRKKPKKGKGGGKTKGEKGAHRMDPEAFMDLERKLRARYKDATLAFHLARLAWRLEPEERALVLEIPEHLLERFRILSHEDGREHQGGRPGQSCMTMTGQVAVGVVFVESSRRGGPKFSRNERAEIRQEVEDGLCWLATQHPSGDLSWVFDDQEVAIDVEDVPDSSDEDYWRFPAIGEIRFQGSSYEPSWQGLFAYQQDLLDANGADNAITFFVTPYGSHWHAWAETGRGTVTLAKRGNWGGWGQWSLDSISAHEACHLFGAEDEYTGRGTPCSACDTLHGCDRIPNGNCGACARPRLRCVMDANHLDLCAYTRGQIGWADIFVEITTAEEAFSGTDDDVELDIGDRTFVLDTVGHNDREFGNVEGHAIWAGGSLARSEIKRIMIRKSADGFAGGWKLVRVRVFHDGALICDERPNKWLEGDDRTWTGCVFDPDYVNDLVVKVTTGDVLWAGTDDDVEFRLGDRRWSLDHPWQNDFEQGRTDTFRLDPGTGLRRSSLHSVGIHKAPDGFAGGWRLKGLEVVVNGATVYNNQGIHRWLQGSDRDWSDSF